jgi:hypothetical protein
MKRRLILIGAAMAVTAGAGFWLSREGSNSSLGRGTQVVKQIQISHVDGNLPDAADFDRFLRRDLGGYFSRPDQKPPLVEFEFLRDGPTQSGVSYPKFYVWVRVNGGEAPDKRGAVRLAAVERKRFEITDFVAESEIRKDRDRIYSIFPAPVCEKILEKLQ